MAKKRKDTDKPKRKTLYTLKLNEEQMLKLRAWCDRQLWAFYEVDYARFAFKGPNVNVVAYESGKLVVQGKGTEEFVQFVLEPEITGEIKLGYDEVHNPEWYEPHAGLDESGKGDFFGPLVTACVIADGTMVKKWQEEGLVETKRVTSDAAVLKLDKMIRSTKGVVVKTTFARMPKYNELYRKFGSNLNKLLAWMHSKSLEEALKVHPVSWGMLDQFSKQPLVQQYFKDSGFNLKMQTKAESDPVVAAASIVSRAVFIREMNKLSEEFGEKLAKGASVKVKTQAKQIVKKFGPEALGKFAKMHFNTAAEVLES